MRSLPFLIVFLLGTNALHAQAPTTFSGRGVGFDATSCVIELSNGNYVVGGANTITCISPWGNLEWSVLLQQTDFVLVEEIMELQTGLICVANVESAQGSDYGIVFELDSTHAVVWQKKYQSGNADTYLNCATLTSDSFIVIGAVTGSLQTFVMKLDLNGNVTWSRDISSGTSIYFVDECTDGNYVLGTYASSVVKIDTAGVVLWQNEYATTSVGATLYMGMAETSSGYIFVGNFYTSAPFSHVLRVIKTDIAGNLTGQYSELPTTWGFNGVCDVAQTDDNGLVVAMWFQYDNNMQPSGYYTRSYMVKIDSTGSIAWSKEFNGAFSANAVTETNDGGFLIATQENFGDTLYSYLHKTDQGGNDNCTTIQKNFSAGSDSVAQYTASHQLSPGAITVSTSQVSVAPNSPGFEFVCYTDIIEVQRKQEFSVSPNPTSETFTLEAEDDVSGATVTVTSLIGDVMFHQTQVALPLTIQTGGAWASGCYFITVTSSSGTSTQKIIVE